jgi:hypothetical protein
MELKEGWIGLTDVEGEEGSIESMGLDRAGFETDSGAGIPVGICDGECGVSGVSKGGLILSAGSRRGLITQEGASPVNPSTP